MKILGKELTFNNNKVYHAGDKPTASEIGAASSSHTHNYAGSSSAGGNANAAIKLATARTINGTSFDGSANITTANWGIARNIQIGNTAKSVNGSANVTWSLSEIGAAAASHGRHMPDTCETITDWNNATKNGWYMGNNAANGPTTVASGGTIWYFGEVITHNTNYVIQVVYQFTASTDAKSIPKYIRAKMNGTWGAWTNVTVSKAVPSNAVFTDTNTWRGVQDNLTSTATDQSLSANQGKVLKGLIDGKAASSHTHNYAGSSSAGGAANSATKLATARSINGTNFDGTGNITTANWGTARNITIADSAGKNTGTAVSVNGSGNITLKLPATIAATLSGNASTATKLQTARTINGVSFDGSANITIPIASHNHDSNYLKTSGTSTLSGNISIDVASERAIKTTGNVGYFFNSSRIGMYDWAKQRDVFAFKPETSELTLGSATITTRVNGTFYGINNIALARGGLWLGATGTTTNCDYLRFGTNIIASDDNKRMYLIDTGGARANVDMGDVSVYSLLLTNSGYPSIRFSNNVRIEYDSGNDALYAAGTKAQSGGLREFRATQCNSTVNAIIAGKRLFIQSGTPSGVATGDVWIQV